MASCCMGDASRSSGGFSALPPGQGFSTYAFRLFRSDGLPAEANREAVTLSQLLPDNGRLERAVVFNMMIDFDFLCDEVARGEAWARG